MSQRQNVNKHELSAATRYIGKKGDVVNLIQCLYAD
jgi:hypothetical protein